MQDLSIDIKTMLQAFRGYPMQDLSIDIKTMPQAFRGYHLLLVITCNQTNFTIAVPLKD